MELSTDPHAVYMRNWYRKNPEKAKEIARRTYAKNREKRLQGMRDYVARTFPEIRLKVLGHYGLEGKVQCAWPDCGWTDVRALSIDHVDGSGAEHRRGGKWKSGMNLYAHLLREGFPEGYQTLCMNHQFVKRHEHGENGGNHF